MTSSNGNIFRVTGSHRWISLTMASDAELWCFIWPAPLINGWVNNREAGELRHHRPHYDFIVIFTCVVGRAEFITEATLGYWRRWGVVGSTPVDHGTESRDVLETEIHIITVTSYERHGVWNHGRLDFCSTACFGLHQISILLARCEGKPPVTGGLPSQRASNAANVPCDDVMIPPPVRPRHSWRPGAKGSFVGSRDPGKTSSSPALCRRYCPWLLNRSCLWKVEYQKNG